MPVLQRERSERRRTELEAVVVQFRVDGIPPIRNSTTGCCDSHDHRDQDESQHDGVLDRGCPLGVVKKVL